MGTRVGFYLSLSIVGFSVYGNTFSALFTHYPIVWTVKCSATGTRALITIQRGLRQHVPLNPNIHSILRGNSPGCAQVTNFLACY